LNTKRTLLCFHANESQVEHVFLQENGYIVLTADSGKEALALLSSRPLDAILIQPLEDSGVARAMKRVNPKVPIVAIVNSLDLPDFASDSVDALVASFDGSQFLLDTLHFLLEVKPAQISPSPHNNDTQSVRNQFAKSAASAWRARVRVA
jgi:CheY-like chemotaxis protein